MFHEPHIPGRDRVPGCRHRRDIVEYTAPRLLERAEIRDDFRGLHDHFAEQLRCGAHNFNGHPHNADQRVYLWQIPAGGAERLPDIRHRIEADDVRTLVAEEEQILGHVIEDRRICVVQIPLIRIEGRHDHLLHRIAPAEVSRRSRREHLRHRAVKIIRNVPVVKEKVAVLKLLLAGTGTSRPLVILRGVIQRKVETNAHTVLVALRRQRREILHGAELRLHCAEVRNRIAAVGPPLRAGEQRHQVNVGRTRLLQVREMFPHPAKRAAEAVCIQHHAKDFIALAPVRICLPLAVQFFHRFRSGLIHPIEHREKVLKSIFVIVIQFRVQPLQFIQPFVKARSKFHCLFLCFSHKMPSRFS